MIGESPIVAVSKVLATNTATSQTIVVAPNNNAIVITTGTNISAPSP